MSVKTVRVNEYDPLWPIQFQQLHALIWPSVSDLALTLEHVGSTSIPGLPAKPVIDLDLVIADPTSLAPVTARLGKLGYTPRGNLGIEDRAAFRSPATSTLAHHLYVCPAGSLALRNHLTFRDHLRRSAEDRAAYGALKRQLAALYPTDMDRYIAGKTGFILQILATHGFGQEEQATIRQANTVIGVRLHASSSDNVILGGDTYAEDAAT